MRAPPICRLATGSWQPLANLVRATDGRAPRLATRVALHDDGDRLRVRFDCDDPEPWAKIAERDGDLWTEEVVELFVAPGLATPRRYLELELNPIGASFDAELDSPHGDRRALALDRTWTCDGLETMVGRWSGGWTAELAMPWRSLARGEDPPADWRLNLFRIDRPGAGEPEFSAWSPTLVEPPEFHLPARFGFLHRLG
ncbi:MAG TPA: carbohydrate-binding family 9-like protein [Thermoanaerobaculia bacterium]|nr:carbohydrate-binding family 9-like protein [Thermoanaerobaculia bacterium]